MPSTRTSSVTVCDVAARANVSPATVTRVLRQDGYPVSQPVKDRVIAAAHELGYKRSHKRNIGKLQSCKTVGFIMPNISNPFYQEASIGAQRELEKNGFEVFLYNAFRRAEKEQTALAKLYEFGVDGVILSASMREKDVLCEYMVKGMKFVLLDQLVPDEEICPHIYLDNASGAQLAVEHLAENGHRRIAFVSTPLTRWSRRLIYDGFCNSMARLGLAFTSDNLLVDDSEAELAGGAYEYQAGYKMAAEFTRRGLNVTAAVVVNDMMAMGLIQGLAAKGISVPGDVSVIGFDNIAYAGIFTPALTTVESPTHEVGRLAAQLLVDQIENNTARPLAIKLQPKLIRRSTVKQIQQIAVGIK